MNLHHLEVFCTVVRCESFSGAAEQLFMTQPAVSMQVQSVEHYFGVQLLERRSRRVALTEPGKLVYQWAREVLRLEADTRKQLDEFKRAETGRIVVGTSMGLGSHVLPLVIHRFKQDYPGAEVVIRLADREEVFQEILAGAIDIGVLTASEIPPGLETEVVGTEDVVFVCAPSHRLAAKQRVSLEDLAEEPFVVPPKGMGYRRVIDQMLAEQGLGEVQVLMEVGIAEGIKRAVEQGVGVGLVMRSAVTLELREGWLCELKAPRGHRTVDLCLVRRPNHRTFPMLQAFTAMLKVAMKEQWWLMPTSRGKGNQVGKGAVEGAPSRRAAAHSR